MSTLLGPILHLAFLLTAPWLMKKLLHLFSPAYYRLLRHPITAVQAVSWLIVCYPLTVIGATYVSVNWGGTSQAAAATVVRTISPAKLPGPYVVPEGTGTTAIAYLYTDEKVNQAPLHGLDGYEGVDVATAGPDTTLHAPFSGTVELSGCDTYSKVPSFLKVHPICGTAATRLDLVSDDGVWRAMLLHGNYTVQQGAHVLQGQPVGTEDCYGWCTGNHTHITLWKNGAVVSYLDYRGVTVKGPVYAPAGTSSQGQALAPFHHGKLSGGSYGTVLNEVQYHTAGLAISHYVPAQGGINCDSDCTTMASGDKVADWTKGRHGLLAAACPQEWGHGTRFNYAGSTYECRDTGGYINCYAPGDFDPALERQATSYYCWVDLLNYTPVPYGTIIPRDGWSIVP